MTTFCQRRGFLGRLILLGAAGTLPAWAIAPVGSVKSLTKKKVMLDQLTLSDFSPHLDATFSLQSESGRPIQIKLVQANALGMSGTRPAHLAQRESFSVVFLAPGDCGLTQQIYHIKHPVMGEFDIFLVPIGRDANGLKCEAIFN